MTILISQQNRGGLTAWPRAPWPVDIGVVVNSGDDVALAVDLCIQSQKSTGWPTICVLMGAFHASARVRSAARRAYAQGVYVIVVEGRDAPIRAH